MASEEDRKNLENARREMAAICRRHTACSDCPFLDHDKCRRVDVSTWLKNIKAR